MNAHSNAAMLDALAARWSRAAATWDVDALAAIYTDDALLFGGRPGHAVGRAAVHEYFKSYRGVILSAKLELVEQNILGLDGGYFLAQGFALFSFGLADGAETRSRLRSSLLVRTGNEAHIRAHHFSPVPEAPPLGNRTEVEAGLQPSEGE